MWRSFAILVLLPLSAIWSVEFYVTQDGSVHLYNAHLMLELLKGNEAVSEFVALNPVLVPNLTGHWILLCLLAIFSPAVTVKLFVSLLFAGLVASTSWLRQQVSGHDDRFTGLLLAVFLAFNEMWFVGAYNFTLGLIGFAFTLGVWWRWRDDLTWGRTAVVAALVLLVFLSHLVCFAALVFVLAASCIWHAREQPSRTAIRTLVAVLPALPFVAAYLRLGSANAAFWPVWTYLQDPWSIGNVLSRLKDSDPFLLLTRKSLPFIEAQSRWFALVSPSVWLIIAVGCLAAATFSARRERTVLLWSGVALFLCVAWVAGPESFGTSHGWMLRERSLLLGLMCFAAAFRLGDHATLKRVAQACLFCGIIYQSAAVWHYSLFANGVTKTMMGARGHIKAGDTLATVILNSGGCQFVSYPRAFLVSFMAIGTNAKVWDNYELNYYLFPVVARNDADREYIRLRGAAGVNFCNVTDPSKVTFNRLAELLPEHYGRIDVLLVWGYHERLEELIGRYYQGQPFYENDGIRLFRRRN